ncbi:MAG: nucleotide-binding protein [Candidatus Eisenbacteria bacterium]
MLSSHKTLLVSFTMVLSAALFGCSGGSDGGQSQGGNSQPASGTMAGEMGSGGMGSGAMNATDNFVGTVAETFDASDYTYVRLEKGGESVWAAGPQSKVSVGEELGVTLAMPMKDFKSTSLDRTFDMLYFVQAFDRGGSGMSGGGMAGGGMSGGDPHAGMNMGGMMGGEEDPDAKVRTMAPTTDLSFDGIAKAEGGQTIGEVWAEKASLSGKPVVVRGKVVKYNGGIMGKNWLHIQDGTGEAAKSTHDLTVTSDASAKVGDIVVVQGVLATDKDFGAGYAYDAIIENAQVSVETAH